MFFPLSLPPAALCKRAVSTVRSHRSKVCVGGLSSLIWACNEVRLLIKQLCRLSSLCHNSLIWTWAQVSEERRSIYVSFSLHFPPLDNPAPVYQRRFIAVAAFELPHYLFCDPLLVVVVAAAAIIALGLLQSTERRLFFHLGGNLWSWELLLRQRSEVH